MSLVKKKNFIIITNYKCAMSSCLQISNIKKIKNLKNIKNEKIIFLYRDTISRIISVFLQWGIGVDDQKFYNNYKKYPWLYKKMKKYCNHFELYKNYLSHKNYIEAFKLFINTLPKMYLSNRHLHPQEKILNDNNIKNIDYSINISNKKDMKKLELLIEDSFPKANINKEITLSFKKMFIDFLERNIEYKKIITTAYWKDIIFLNKLMA
jgi:hypothetical protein